MAEEPKARILVVEDDPGISDMVCHYLRKYGYAPTPLYDGREVHKHILKSDVLVLDLNLPDTDGLEILKTTRKERNDIPILIMSARADGTDRVLGLELGADDYLGKPIIPAELVARVKALLRRVVGRKSSALILDEGARTVTSYGVEVTLSPQEFAVLKLLFDSPGKTFSREEVLTTVWEGQHSKPNRKVDQAVSNIRVKFADLRLESPIQSVWGAGYRLIQS